MRFILAILLALMSLFVICAKSIYQMLGCAISGGGMPRSAQCDNVRSGRHCRPVFVVPARFSVAILLLVSLPMSGAYPVIGSPDSPDSLHNCSNVRVFTESILFPKASDVVLHDFAGNASAIDSIRSFLSLTDPRCFLNVKIIGSYSPEGKYAFNKKLAEARARALARLVSALAPGVNPEVSTIGRSAAVYSVDYRYLRRAELQISYSNIASACGKLLPDTVNRKDTIVPKGDFGNEACRVNTTISSLGG